MVDAEKNIWLTLQYLAIYAVKNLINVNNLLIFPTIERIIWYLDLLVETTVFFKLLTKH